MGLATVRCEHCPSSRHADSSGSHQHPLAGAYSQESKRWYVHLYGTIEASRLIPWIAGLYDTPEAVVAEITYTPPPLPFNSEIPARPPPSEQAYIDYLTSPTSSSFDPADPIEVNLAREVSNPHSRANKQGRWQARLRHEKTLLEEYVKVELKDLQGRTRREARAEATFKWKQRIDADRKAELKRRWQLRGQEAKLLRKRARAVKKEARRKQKLADMVLEQGSNQVIPP